MTEIHKRQEQIIESFVSPLTKFKPIAWHLPRPNPTRYKGSVPLHFEKKLLDLTGIPNNKDLLNMFSGDSKMGFTVDVKPETNPDLIHDCHDLPFDDNTFGNSFRDSPYSTQESIELYGTGPLHPTKFTAEQVRVTKPNGLVMIYHINTQPNPLGCKYLGTICIITRVQHKLRTCQIFRKEFLH